MKSNDIKTHIANASPPADYVSKGKVGGLEPANHWMRKEFNISQALGASMPDEAFSQIKDTETVKEAWDILISTYQDRIAVL